MFFKRSLITFVIFLILILAVLTYQNRRDAAGSPLFGAFSYPLSIIERGGEALIKGIEGVFRRYILSDTGENKRLIEKAMRAEHDNNLYLETRLENERLRSLLELKSRRPDYITAAEIFARDPTNWFKIIWINKGSSDGIAKDMVAVTPLGPVGRVSSAFKDRSKIMLITDVNSSVAVMLQSSRIEGILSGTGNNRCYMKYVPVDAEVVVGDGIITSGLDGIYPEGLLIGYVTGVGNESDEFFQTIEVAPAQNPSTVEEAAILKK